MSKDFKRTYFIFLPYECAAAEEYLEEMAEKGWLLESVKGHFLKFKKIEAKKIKFSVDVFNKVSAFEHKDSDVALEYREYCKAAGWNFVCETGKIQIFYTEDDKETISIHTDAEEKFKAVFKASLYNVGCQFFITLIFIFSIYIQLFKGSTNFVLASNLSIFSIVGMLFVILITSIRVINFFLWVIKARGKLKENKLMPYNNYRQLRIKNILIKAYTIIISLIFLSFFNFDNSYSKGVIISLIIIIMCIPTISMMFSKNLINKKRYSKNTNKVIIIGSILVSMFLTVIFTGSLALRSTMKIEESKVKSEEVSLTLMDFGYTASKGQNPLIHFDKSILAQVAMYSYSNEDTSLFYDIFESQYPWVIKFHQNRLLDRIDSYGLDLKQEKTKLPSDIKVYSYNKKKSFVLVTENKVVDIKKSFSYINDDEFLDKVYKKLFN